MNLAHGATLGRELKSFLKSVLPMTARKVLRRALGRSVRTYTTLEEVDEVFQRAEAGFRVSEEEGRRVLAGFELRAPRNVPADPRSAEYRDFQFELYRRISGRPSYSLENEYSKLDVESARRSPFPYDSRLPTLVGDYLIAIGFLLKAMNLPAPARILEFGPGWGNTTVEFLRMGYSVTGIEVDPGFAELLQHRCAPFGDRWKLVQSDMLKFHTEERHDAAVFFESFHHCSDHVQMLQNLGTMLPRDGSIVFAGEPIGDFATPWGVRLDGMSLWSMRRHGWLELGFQEGYLFGLLRDLGWEPTRYQSAAISTITDVIVAKRRGLGGGLPARPGPARAPPRPSAPPARP